MFHIPPRITRKLYSKLFLLLLIVSFISNVLITSQAIFFTTSIYETNPNGMMSGSASFQPMMARSNSQRMSKMAMSQPAQAYGGGDMMMHDEMQMDGGMPPPVPEMMMASEPIVVDRQEAAVDHSRKEFCCWWEGNWEGSYSWTSVYWFDGH